jgi:hypothetical protein
MRVSESKSSGLLGNGARFVAILSKAMLRRGKVSQE